MQGHYKIYALAQHRLVSIRELVQSVNHTAVLFFGEDHNDSIAHYLEDSIYKALVQQYGKVALSMEMFETDCQTVLNEYLEGFITEKQLMANARPWNNYADYRPIVETAHTNHLPVIAANAPHRYASMVNHKGMAVLDSLDASSKSFIAPLPYPITGGRYYDKFAGIMGGHDHFSKNMYAAQNLWDATMANSIHQFHRHHKKYKIFQVNGRFHSDEKLGTLAQLQRFNPRLAIINISCFSDAHFDSPNWSSFENLGDYIIITDPVISRTF